MATYKDEIGDGDQSQNSAPDCFRDQFKRYKRKRPLPDFSEVIDFDRSVEFMSQIEEFQLTNPEGFEKAPDGLIDVSLWQAFRLKSNPGFLFICNPFRAGCQRYWVKRCLRDYPVKPNQTNLDIHLTLSPADNIWQDEGLESSNPFSKGSLISHLRWATLGYHYEWNNRVYFEDKVSEFPSDLSLLTRYVAATLGYPRFCPQSGIVNFYNMESTLCGHTDHSEYDKRAPLISFSFGQSAIFLIGGVTKEISPTALYLRSGDICVMMEEARLAYHAVPRILPADQDRFSQAFHVSDTPSEILPASVDKCDNCDISECAKGLGGHKNSVHKLADPEQNTAELTDPWERYENYMRSARVNVNVRQVLQHGQTFPKQEETS